MTPRQTLRYWWDLARGERKRALEGLVHQVERGRLTPYDALAVASEIRNADVRKCPGCGSRHLIFSDDLSDRALKTVKRWTYMQPVTILDTCSACDEPICRKCMRRARYAWDGSRYCEPCADSYRGPDPLTRKIP